MARRYRLQLVPGVVTGNSSIVRITGDRQLQLEHFLIYRTDTVIDQRGVLPDVGNIAGDRFRSGQSGRNHFQAARFPLALFVPRKIMAFSWKLFVSDDLGIRIGALQTDTNNRGPLIPDGGFLAWLHRQSGVRSLTCVFFQDEDRLFGAQEQAIAAPMGEESDMRIGLTVVGFKA